MPPIEEFRFKAHHLLIALDATTTQLMMLVVSREVSGERWNDAVVRQKLAYEAWTASLDRLPNDSEFGVDSTAIPLV